MARPEPFRAMLEQAFAAEGKLTPPSVVPHSDSAPRTLERRLDQLLLAGGVTPPRGQRIPSARSDVPLRLEPPAAARAPIPPSISAAERCGQRATDALLDHLDDLDATARLDRPAAVDAALYDTLAAAEATKVNVGQRAAATVRPRSDDVSLPRLVVPALEAPIALSHVPDGSSDAPRPLPKKPSTTPPVAVASPPPVLSAPPPRIMQVPEDTLPSLSSSSSSSSSSGKFLTQSDLYRLQLEFEDTPARPLPAHASVKPLPLVSASLGEALDRARGISSEAPALVDADHLDSLEQLVGDEAFEALRGLESPDLQELEGIEDLDALARALGLKSVSDISISSIDGAPVFADDELGSGRRARASQEGGAPVRELGPAEVTAIRRAAILAALGEGKETVFTSSEGAPITATRPALQARTAAVPVIVRIPSRPRVTAAAREQGRKLYLRAVEELGKGDKSAAVVHLKLAISHDDGVQLYRDLLAQLVKGTKSDEAAVTTEDHDGPALLVMRTSGRMSTPREEWRR